MTAPNEVDRLLGLANKGDSSAMRQVLAELHDRLRWIARGQMSREDEGHTLGTDGLVHEAYLRLAGLQRMDWRDRQHVLSMAARTMRRILIDYAEARSTGKRGHGMVPMALDDADAVAAIDPHTDDLHALDEALVRLEGLNPRQHRVVECRFFGGLSIEETAVVLDLSPATVKRDWMVARAWLNRELRG